MTKQLVTRGNAALHTEIDHTVSPATLDLMAERLAENTRAAYVGQWDAYSAWCADVGRTPLPATPHTIAEYAGHLAGLDRSPATFEQAWAAIVMAHDDNGHERPARKPFAAVLTAHKRNRATRGTTRRQSAPITLSAVQAMVETLDTATLAGLRDRAVTVLGYSGALRRSELAQLAIGDLRETEDGLIVTIRTSKTDKESTGELVHLPYGAHAPTCPVRATRAWVAALAERGATSGPLLRRIRRGDVLTTDGMSGAAINELVKRLAKRAGLPITPTAHGLRAGVPTDASRAGVPTALIAEHGRWSKTSPTIMEYVRSADRWRDNPLRHIGL